MKILHCHSTFSLGGKEARCVRLMNLFGDRAEHLILSAVTGALTARDAIDRGVRASFPGEAAPSLSGKPSLGRYNRLSRYMADFDLVLTYNWGSMDAVGAHRIFSRFRSLPPLIHHEDGFNQDETAKLNPKRNGFRRLMLPTAQMLVVPSQRLERIARDVWKQPADRLARIPNGIDVDRYTVAPAPAAIAGLIRAPGEVIVGTVAGLRPVKNLPRLVRAVAALPDHVRLVIVGEGPEAQTIMAEAARLNISARVHLAGFMADPQYYIGAFDIFALSSDSEQFPISLVEAMAAALPAVSTDVGDVRAMVSAANRPYIVAAGDEPNYAAALAKLVDDAPLRRSIGTQNQALAQAEYGEAAMLAKYAVLYGIAM